MKQKQQKQNQGYTLVEAIVAVGILASALLGLVALAVQSVQVSDVSETKLQAEYLAQEGIELVRAVRESNNGYFKDAGSAITYDRLIENLAIGASRPVNIDPTGRVCGISSSCNSFSLYKNRNGDVAYVIDPGANPLSKFQRKIVLETINFKMSQTLLFCNISKFSKLISK